MQMHRKGRAARTGWDEEVADSREDRGEPLQGLDLKSSTSASQTLAGYEAMARIRKGQVASAPANDMGAQRNFIATLFGGAT